MSSFSFKSKIIILIFLVIVSFFLDIMLGSIKIPVNELFKVLSGGAAKNESWETVILMFRLPKALTAILVGIALSVSGLQMQILFRNPLAGPYVLGISSGASLGVALLILGSSVFAGASIFANREMWQTVLAAWLGAGIITAIILAVSIKFKDNLTVLIIGILFGSGIGAIVSLLQYFGSEIMLKSYIVWTMGSLGGLNFLQLKILFIIILIGISINTFLLKPLNLWTLGEEQVKNSGYNPQKISVLIFISTSLLAGTVTAFCGPLAFIGIAVPHLARIFLSTSDTRKLLPVTVLLGAFVLLLSDIISNLPGSDATLPINSVTALIGIPVVFWIILRNNRIGRIN